MTRRVGISWLPIRWGLFFLFISGLQLLSAQEDSTRFTLDSMLIKPKMAFVFRPSRVVSGRTP